MSRTSIIEVENTIEGNIPNRKPKRYKSLAEENNLTVHMDGARVFNASVSLKTSVAEIASYCDTITFVYQRAWVLLLVLCYVDQKIL